MIKSKDFEDGFEMACQMLDDLGYTKTSTHPYNIADCIRAKINKIPKNKIRKNAASQFPSQGLPENILQELGEKEVMIAAFAKIREMFRKREWIMEGRGSYRYDDDRYKEEVRYLFDECDAIANDTWKNIKTKTFEYREKIIADYKASAPSQGLREEIIKREEEVIKNSKIINDNKELAETKAINNAYAGKIERQNTQIEILKSFIEEIKMAHGTTISKLEDEIESLRASSTPDGSQGLREAELAEWLYEEFKKEGFYYPMGDNDTETMRTAKTIASKLKRKLNE